MSRTQRLTIADLARELGLSKSAVSYALNGEKGVSEETRRRVTELAQRRNFRPHQGARALRQKRARTVGMVLARDPQQIAYEPFYNFVMAGLEEVLVGAHFSLMLRIVGQAGDDLEAYREWALDGRVDGVFVFDGRAADPRVDLLVELGLPAVLIGDFGSSPEQLCQLHGAEPDDAGLIMEHLASLGHRRVGHIRGPAKLLHEQNRARAIVEAAGRLGLQLDATDDDYTVDGGARAANELLDRVDPPTALIGSNDQMTLGALRAAQGRGMSLPEEVSLVSWDDCLTGQLVTPAITALDRKPVELGNAAARMLLSQLDGAEPRGLAQPMPPSSLVVRESSAPPKITIQ